MVFTPHLAVSGRQITGARGLPGLPGLPGVPGDPAGAWMPDTAYAVGEVTTEPGGSRVKCVVGHTSSALFATDAATKWKSLATYAGTKEKSDLDAQLGSTYASRDDLPTTPSHVPLYVSTLEACGSSAAAPGARTGLPTTTYPGGQGYTVERIVTPVTGAAGAYSLTTTDTATLAALDASATISWDGSVLNSDGRAINVTVVDVVGGTITLLNPLPFAISGGQLASRIDQVSGQHLTSIGYKAFAQHIAAVDPMVGTRGGILDGQWDTLPSSHRTVWTANAALTAYGVQNSASPVVQSAVLAQAPMNVIDGTNLYQRPNASAGGMQIGTHVAGHGATATLRTGPRRPVVIEFTTVGSRNNGIITTGRIRVKVTSPDGIVLHDKTVPAGMRWHRIPVSGFDYVTVEVTNTDGAIYYLNVSQLTVREAGAGGRLASKKALLIGDSWTTYTDGILGDALTDALGCEVVTYGVGGMTTDWGIAYLDTALATAPGVDTVIVHFYTNDLNNNQSTTFVDPTGATVPLWPNGLTAAQAEARWRSQINKLVSMIQARGLRPVIVGPGGCNVGTQLNAALHMEQPGLVDWTATASELTDTTAYVNVVGKNTGTPVKVGTIVKRASGPNAADAWVDPAGDALVPLQKATLKQSSYRIVTGVAIGTDSNADGLSDGFTYHDFGPAAGDVYTPSIVGGNQRWASSWAASGTSENRRVKMSGPVTSGREYLVIWDVFNATASQTLNNSWSDITTPGGATTFLSGNASAVLTMSAGGVGQVLYRATAGSTGTAYTSIARTRTNSGTHTMDIRKAFIVDLTALLADAPNLAGMTIQQLADFFLALQP